jgi:predicted transcriptional regulator
MNRIGHRQDMLLTLIANNPGITTAELNRITNSHGRSHIVTYDAVGRLLRRGIVARTDSRSNRGVGLQIALGYERA